MIFRSAVTTLFLFALCLLVVEQSHAAELVGWWNFDDNVVDQSGNGNDGVLNNGAGYNANVPAAIGGGKSLILDGNDDHVRIEADPTLNSPNFTLAYFLNQNGAAQGGGIFERITSRGGDTFETAMGNGGGFSYFTPAIGWNTPGGVPPAPASDWIHVAWRKNGANLRLLVDGVEVLNDARDVGTPSGIMNIGARHTGNEGFQGLLDDVALFDDSVDPLTDDDIADIAANGVARFLIPIPEPSSLLLAAVATLGLSVCRRRRRRR
ncbi:MAG: LamG domain-containing protein [Planctomycetes bacterium]|nr:LamG domain-containing protein [Planctomycetota bacterium]